MIPCHGLSAQVFFADSDTVSEGVSYGQSVGCRENLSGNAYRWGKGI